MTSSDTNDESFTDMETAEARMRRSLDMVHRSVEHPSGPGPDRRPSTPAGARPRARFVQDGDVPVTVVSRGNRDAAGATGPSPSRLGAAEAALATERTLRTRAERALHEANAVIHDLRTKQGHADLARHEAHEAVLRERDAAEALRTEFATREAALVAELEAERTARQAAERPAEASAIVRKRRAVPEGEAPARKPRKPAAERPVREPKPVKWWR